MSAAVVPTVSPIHICRYSAIALVPCLPISPMKISASAASTRTVLMLWHSDLAAEVQGHCHVD
jgi:hypothetical protein